MAKQHQSLPRRGLRRLVLGAALLLSGLALAPGVQAQGPGGMNMSPDERATQRVTLLTERVQLTAQQQAAVKPILVKQFTDQTVIFQKIQAGGDRQAVMGEMQALRTKVDADITALLTTPAQKAAYKTLIDEETARRANRGAGGG